MNYGLPFRAPCGGWPERRTIRGGCYQHRKAAEASITRYENVTRVPDFVQPPDPPYHAEGIPPYPRRGSNALGDWPQTATGDCIAPPCTVGAAYQALCDEWPTIIANVYSTDNTTVDQSQCRKLGFKNVQAMRYWHGMFGFMSHDPGGRYDRIRDNVDRDPPSSNCQCDLEFEQATPDQTKYRTLDLVGTYKKWADGVLTNNGAAQRKITVNAGSGVMTQDAWSQTAGDDGTKAATFLYDNRADAANTAAALYVSCIYPKNAPGYTYTETRTGQNYAITVVNDFDNFAEYTGSVAVQDGTMTGTQWARDGNTPPGSLPYIVDEFSCTNTTFTRTHTENQYSGATLVSKEEWQVTGTLSNPHTAATVLTDINALLGWWDLANDAVYPWRTDGYLSIAPLVSRSEPPGAVSPLLGIMGSGLGEGWTDPNAAIYDGSVRGGPKPAGYLGYFDSRHRSIRQCVDGNSNTYHFRYAFGAWNRIPTFDVSHPVYAALNAGDETDFVVPPTATQWTENWFWDNPNLEFCAGNQPGGAWVIQKQGLVMAQKWAEIKIPRPSYNFARPCGADRFLLDETKVACVLTAVGTPALVTLHQAVTGITTGQLCLVCGVTGVTNGVYEVTRTSDTVYELTTLKWLAPARTDCGTGIFGKLRWQTAPPICGRLAVASATQNGSAVDIVLAAAAPYLRTGDAVSFTDVGGLGANLGVTVADETHFSVTGTVGAYGGGGYVASYGAAGYQWNDEDAKGDFLWAEWLFDYRDYQERNRVIDNADYCSNCEDHEPASRALIRPYQAGHGMPQEVRTFTVVEDCLAFSVCDPQVMCLSPNGEVWANGKTRGFPSLPLDERYGARWQGAVVQHMENPLWQAPHRACVEGVDPAYRFSECAHGEDDGTCQQDTCFEDVYGGQGDHYFPHRPLVEARASVPAGASLPTATGEAIDSAGDYGLSMPGSDAVHIGFLGIAALNVSATPVDGNVLPPPAGMGYISPAEDTLAQPQPVLTPWGLYIREMLCVCGSGRFAEDYMANGVRVNCP